LSSAAVTGWLVALCLPLLALHMASVALARALRTYSRSRLEEVCNSGGHPERADEIARLDEKTERAAESLAVLTGLVLAAMLGAATVRLTPHLAAESVLAIALILGGLGYVTAGVAGRVYAEPILDRVWPITQSMRVLMAPFTFASRLMEAHAYRRWRRSVPTPRPASVEIEIHSSGDSVEREIHADLPESTREILERAVDLSHRDVAELMTPRSAVLSLSASVSATEAAVAAAESGFSRIPLFGENRDDIVGILYAKDLFARLTLSGREDPAGIQPRKLARPPLFVPESKNAQALLDELLHRRVQMAIVLDEYGGVSGLVTLEDLLEALVGPIDDEHDEPTPDDPVIPVGDSSYEVDAAIPVEALNERLGLRLPTDEDYLTIGGYAFNALGRLPQPGESFRRDGVEFTIVAVAEHSIRRLRLDLRPAESVVVGQAS
jgi:CBS domain containing-hemolysin-like protein